MFLFMEQKKEMKYENANERIPFKNKNKINAKYIHSNFRKTFKASY